MSKLKYMERKNWSDIKNLESVDGKFKDGSNFRLIKNIVTGEIEIFLDQNDLSNCQQVDFTPVIISNGFYNN